MKAKTLTPTLVLAGLLLSGVSHAQTFSGMQYAGGPVLANAEIVAVYLGTPAESYREAMDRFYAELIASSALTWLTEYSTPTQTIGNGSFVGSFVLPSPPTVQNPFSIGYVLDDAIHVGRLPGTTTNTVYMVHIAPGIGWANPACGMHLQYASLATGRGWGPSPIITYAILPDLTGWANCSSGLSLISAQRLTAYHELVESITDPGSAIVGAVTTLDNLAWRNAATSSLWNPTEISDSGTTGCATGTIRTSMTNTQVIELQWSNFARGCILPATNPWDVAALAASSLF